jgi:hypothetical protein
VYITSAAPLRAAAAAAIVYMTSAAPVPAAAAAHRSCLPAGTPS